ncbi:hypothetical protein A2Z33_03500 [Candidatus Gottesmanbacteria bacterium RBG_16_52_11]|uniref:HTH arsR-type domain-containing protein n=1 Tax=Candidatus Gottesmanbacteria bacterium RBG_16_52_11 TaxID=1798374 RepID=A0A1F5YVT8_9BACT|nr:MAG: hypothetical protein A2Z33_03500 [Candidatus Gottesmanbacteria bacterium RBG_16_52_11]
MVPSATSIIAYRAGERKSTPPEYSLDSIRSHAYHIYMNKRSYNSGHRDHPHFVTSGEMKNLRKLTMLHAREKDFLAVIRNLCDQTKFKISMILSRVEEMSVADLSHVLDVPQTTVSHALSDLKNAGVVDSCRCGKFVCYSLSDKGEKMLRLRDAGTGPEEHDR